VKKVGFLVALLAIALTSLTACSDDTDLSDLFPDGDKDEQPSPDPNKLQTPNRNPDKPEEEEQEPPPKSAAPSTPVRR
jgi:hypothetical protein